MADIHILANNQVVMHIPTPSGDNDVGVSWRDCVKFQNPTSSLRDAVDDGNPKGWEITAAEKADVESGALFERTTTISLDKFQGTLVERRDQLIAMAVKKAKPVLEALKSAKKGFKYFGYSGSAS